MNKPGEQAKGKACGKLRNPPKADDPTNLIRLGPAKEGKKKNLEHFFCRSAFLVSVM
jgi:hypothetical protein